MPQNVNIQPYSEPLRVTLRRTVTIAVVAGAIMALSFGGLKYWPAATLLAMWPSLGGHWVELWYLNWLRPRLSTSDFIQKLTRILFWFAGGILLGLGMQLTALLLPGLKRFHWPNWWFAGVGFIGIELVVHSVLTVRARLRH